MPNHFILISYLFVTSLSIRFVQGLDRILKIRDNPSTQGFCRLKIVKNCKGLTEVFSVLKLAIGILFQKKISESSNKLQTVRYLRKKDMIQKSAKENPANILEFR